MRFFGVEDYVALSPALPPGSLCRVHTPLCHVWHTHCTCAPFTRRTQCTSGHPVQPCLQASSMCLSWLDIPTTHRAPLMPPFGAMERLYRSGRRYNWSCEMSRKPAPALKQAPKHVVHGGRIFICKVEVHFRTQYFTPRIT